MRASSIKSWGLAIALVVISLTLSFAKPNFLTVPNLINVMRQISINGILAVGVTYVLLTGGVDLSLGSLVAVSGVVAATLARDAVAVQRRPHWPAHRRVRRLS